METPIGLIAGAGRLPALVADRVQHSGRDVVVIRLEGMAQDDLERFPGKRVKLGALGEVVRTLQDADCDSLAFAGKVTRPNFKSLGLDELALSHLPNLLAVADKGDDALMRAVGDIFETEGFTITRLDDIARDLLCPSGVIARPDQANDLTADFARAFNVAGIIGAEDIGQGCVVCDGVVLAVEAQEGTDAMLARVPQLPVSLRGTLEKRRGVLVKRTKPGQDLRMDLPVIGMETFQLARDASLAGIGLEAGRSLLIDRDEMIAVAALHGIEIVGLNADGKVE
ncbi:MAG: UDP-2,3-diacylglucosamine diphosphatase LpxI [Pseudomonadota bacterium]